MSQNYLELANNLGSAVGASNGNATYAGINAAADMVNEQVPLMLATVFTTTTTTGYTTYPAADANSIYGSGYGTNTQGGLTVESGQAPVAGQPTDVTAPATTPQTMPAAETQATNQFVQMFNALVALLAQFMAQNPYGTTGGAAPDTAADPAVIDGSTGAPVDTTQAPVAAEEPATTVSTADPERQAQIDTMNGTNVTKRENERLEEKITKIMEDPENAKKEDIEAVIDQLTNMTNERYIAFKQYFEKGGKDLEDVIALAEGKVGEEAIDKLNAKADEAEAWLKGDVEKADEVTPAEDTTGTPEADTTEETPETSEAAPISQERRDQLEIDAVKLYDALEKWGRDDKIINDILVSGDYTNAEIAEIAKMFEERFGKSLSEMIKSESLYDSKDMLLAKLDAVEKNPNGEVKEKSIGDIAADASKIFHTVTNDEYGSVLDIATVYTTLFDGYSDEDIAKLVEYYNKEYSSKHYGMDLQTLIKSSTNPRVSDAITKLIDNAMDTAGATEKGEEIKEEEKTV